MPAYFSLANSSFLFFFCAIVVLFVIVQSLIYLRKAWLRGKEIGMTGEEMKKIMTSSAVFSIVPSLPIVIMMMLLMPVLGKYVPWLRLSVIGSGTYEYIAADFTVKALGLSGLTDPGLNTDAFVTILWAMTLGILVGPLFIITCFKSYDKKLKSLSEKKNSFMPYFVNAMFFGMLAVFIAPIALDTSDFSKLLVFLFSGMVAILLAKISKNPKLKALKDFSFPLSMLSGMLFAVIINFI